MKLLILTVLLTVNAFGDTTMILVNQEFTATIDTLYCETSDEFYDNVELKSESEITSYSPKKICEQIIKNEEQ